MKKLGFLIMVFIFSAVGMINAQNNQTNNRPGVQYFQKDIAPAIKQAQEKFINALSPKEQQELKGIQDELKAFQADRQQNRYSGQRNFNQQQWAARQQTYQAIVAKAQKLAAAHPKAAAAYSDFVKENAPKWQEEMGKIWQNRSGYRANRPMMRNGQMPFFEKLADPAFGLIMNPDNMGMFNGMRPMRPGSMQPGNRGRGMGMGNGPGNWSGRKGMRGQGMGCMQGRRGRGQRGMGMMRAGRGAGFMAMQNPEVQAKVLAYAKENIFPVLNKERAAFDKNLSNSEKRAIEKARKERASIQKEMQQYMANGMCPLRGQPDSARLALRLKMSETMIPVKQIALKHFSELESVVGKVRQGFIGWRAGMRQAVAQDLQAGYGRGYGQGMGPCGKGMMGNRQGRRGFQGRAGMRAGGMGMLGPVKFLLYDPAHPENALPVIMQVQQVDAQ